MAKVSPRGTARTARTRNNASTGSDAPTSGALSFVRLSRSSLSPPPRPPGSRSPRRACCLPGLPRFSSSAAAAARGGLGPGPVDSRGAGDDVDDAKPCAARAKTSASRAAACATATSLSARIFSTIISRSPTSNGGPGGTSLKTFKTPSAVFTSSSAQCLSARTCDSSIATSPARFAWRYRAPTRSATISASAELGRSRHRVALGEAFGSALSGVVAGAAASGASRRAAPFDFFFAGATLPPPCPPPPPSPRPPPPPRVVPSRPGASVAAVAPPEGGGERARFFAFGFAMARDDAAPRDRCGHPPEARLASPVSRFPRSIDSARLAEARIRRARLARTLPASRISRACLFASSRRRE
eukprot:13650-Pelagococcus_subviridis.AAC.2